MPPSALSWAGIGSGFAASRGPNDVCACACVYLLLLFRAGYLTLHMLTPPNMYNALLMLLAVPACRADSSRGVLWGTCASSSPPSFIAHPSFAQSSDSDFTIIYPHAGVPVLTLRELGLLLSRSLLLLLVDREPDCCCCCCCCGGGGGGVASSHSGSESSLSKPATIFSKWRRVCGRDCCLARGRQFTGLLQDRGKSKKGVIRRDGEQRKSEGVQRVRKDVVIPQPCCLPLYAPIFHIADSP